MVRSKMENSFYEDHGFPHRFGIGNDVNNLKRNMTLDLNLNHPAKRTKLSSAPVLLSPDINMLKLGSPDLEKFLSNGSLITATPTPSTAQILFPRTPTEEQEIYVKGFVDALSELQASDSSQMSSSGSSLQLDLPISSSGNVYTNLDTPTSFLNSNYGSLSGVNAIVKEEPQTVPSICSSPPMSPIDMEDQERIKLERKRQRNRIAASKCRRRKLERISRLEDKVKVLKGENAELGTVVHKLKEQVCNLKQQVMEHVQSGCEMPHVMISPHMSL